MFPRCFCLPAPPVHVARWPSRLPPRSCPCHRCRWTGRTLEVSTLVSPPARNRLLRLAASPPSPGARSPDVAVVLRCTGLGSPRDRDDVVAHLVGTRFRQRTEARVVCMVPPRATPAPADVPLVRFLHPLLGFIRVVLSQDRCAPAPSPCPKTRRLRGPLFCPFGPRAPTRRLLPTARSLTALPVCSDPELRACYIPLSHMGVRCVSRRSSLQLARLGPKPSARSLKLPGDLGSSTRRGSYGPRGPRLDPSDDSRRPLRRGPAEAGSFPAALNALRSVSLAISGVGLCRLGPKTSASGAASVRRPPRAMPSRTLLSLRLACRVVLRGGPTAMSPSP